MLIIQDKKEKKQPDTGFWPWPDPQPDRPGDRPGALMPQRGEKGDPGAAASVAVGTVTTLEPGEDATVTNSGTEFDAVLNFGIPKGEKGDKEAVTSYELNVVETLQTPIEEAETFAARIGGLEYALYHHADSGEYKWNLKKTVSDGGVYGANNTTSATDIFNIKAGTIIKNSIPCTGKNNKETYLFVAEYESGVFKRRTRLMSGHLLQINSDADSIRLVYGYQATSGNMASQDDIDQYFSVSYLNHVDYKKGKTYVGVVMDQVSRYDDAGEKYRAMRELLDIARKGNGTTARVDKCAVCELPSEPAMYEGFNFDIIYGKNQDEQSIPASTTKVMSLITAMPYITSIMEKVTVTADDDVAGSGQNLLTGDIVTIEDLMYDMMLASSNKASKVLAHYVGGKILSNSSASASSCVAAFVTEMNRKAQMIGCENSEFTSPSGYSTTTKSTPSDLMRITIAAASYKEILRIWNKNGYTIKVTGANQREIQLTSSFPLSTFDDKYYIIGSKGGAFDYGEDNTQHANALVVVARVK